MCQQQHFDVVFTYNPQDENLVLNVADQLRKFGLSPWVEAEYMRPGTAILDVIQNAIESINCAAIFLGSGSFLNFQLMQLNSHISQIEKGKILIPVLLPGVDQIPDTMLFLKEIHSVRFAHGIDDGKAIEDLVWAITRQKPEKKPENSTEQEFDVLLCYNHEDKLTVQNLANQLKQKQIRPWLDIQEVRAGSKIYKEVLKDIKRIRSVAFLIGSQGCPWQKEPLECVIEEFLELDVRLIPIMLKNVPSEPELPVYLRHKRPVDFRDEESDPLGQLIWAIRNL